MTRRLARTLGLALALSVSVLVAWDLGREPEDQWTARFLLAGIHAYQKTLSPHLSTAGVRCRFQPTCSHYAEAVIQRDGALAGSVRAAGRIIRCGPWTSAGTRDHP